MTTPLCRDRCYDKRFIAKYQIRSSLARTYKNIRDKFDTSKKFQEGWRYCRICGIYLQMGNEIYCFCCGWKTTGNRRNPRSNLKWKLRNTKIGKKHTLTKSDILKNIDKFEAWLAS
jgi:hypothetical protein